MKLFVWANPYHVSYGSSLVVAVANTVEEAKVIASTAEAYRFGEFEQDFAKPKLGKPTRVLDLPCAEWHEWAE